MSHFVQPRRFHPLGKFFASLINMLYGMIFQCIYSAESETISKTGFHISPKTEILCAGELKLKIDSLMLPRVDDDSCQTLLLHMGRIRNFSHVKSKTNSIYKKCLSIFVITWTLQHLYISKYFFPLHSMMKVFNKLINGAKFKPIKPSSQI